MFRFGCKGLLAAAVLSLLTGGCNQHDNASPVTHSEQPPSLRPVVALVPVIDSTKSDLSWNLADEWTASLDYRLSDSDRLYLVDLKTTYETLQKAKPIPNPFGMDCRWLKKTFPKNEFVVFLEIVEHEEVLRQDKKNPVAPNLCTADLNMGVRVRVFDLRGDQPVAVLQEILHDTHFVPRPFTRANFDQIAWGEEGFDISPMGLAHATFVKEIARRIEDYILLQK